MYERSYGAKYVKDLSVVDIAKRIREDIKAAVAAGELPASLKVSVRKVHHRSLAVKLSGGVDGPLYVAGRYKGDARLSNEAIRIRRAVEKIANAYNYDGSEISLDYFDVNYYLSVDFDWEWARLRNAEYEAARRGELVEELDLDMLGF
jgi:hypothetical protein